MWVVHQGIERNIVRSSPLRLLGQELLWGLIQHEVQSQGPSSPGQHEDQEHAPDRTRRRFCRQACS